MKHFIATLIQGSLDYIWEGLYIFLTARPAWSSLELGIEKAFADQTYKCACYNSLFFRVKILLKTVLPDRNPQVGGNWAYYLICT